jgi:hypothetical protein
MAEVNQGIVRTIEAAWRFASQTGAVTPQSPA